MNRIIERPPLNRPQPAILQKYPPQLEIIGTLTSSYNHRHVQRPYCKYRKTILKQWTSEDYMRHKKVASEQEASKLPSESTLSQERSVQCQAFNVQPLKQFMQIQQRCDRWWIVPDTKVLLDDRLFTDQLVKTGYNSKISSAQQAPILQTDGMPFAIARVQKPVFFVAGAAKPKTGFCALAIATGIPSVCRIGDRTCRMLVPYIVLHDLTAMTHKRLPAWMRIPARRVAEYIRVQTVDCMKAPVVVQSGLEAQRIVKNNPHASNDAVINACLQMNELYFYVVLISDDAGRRQRAAQSNIPAYSLEQVRGIVRPTFRNHRECPITITRTYGEAGNSGIA